MSDGGSSVLFLSGGDQKKSPSIMPFIQETLCLLSLAMFYLSFSRLWALKVAMSVVFFWKLTSQIHRACQSSASLCQGQLGYNDEEALQGSRSSSILKGRRCIVCWCSRVHLKILQSKLKSGKWVYGR